MIKAALDITPTSARAPHTNLVLASLEFFDKQALIWRWTTLTSCGDGSVTAQCGIIPLGEICAMHISILSFARAKRAIFLCALFALCSAL